MLIDKALKWGYVLSPLAAPHHRREGLVFDWPSDKGKRSRPSPGGGRGNPKLALSAIVAHESLTDEDETHEHELL